MHKRSMSESKLDKQFWSFTPSPLGSKNHDTDSIGSTARHDSEADAMDGPKKVRRSRSRPYCILQFEFKLIYDLPPTTSATPPDRGRDDHFPQRRDQLEYKCTDGRCFR